MPTTQTRPSPVLPAPGTQVTVTTPDGYKAHGRLIGLTAIDGTPRIRVLTPDRLERRIAVEGATVATAA